MTLDTLKLFCADRIKDPDRGSIWAPFVQDGFVWATDGRIAVRVPVFDGIPEPNPLVTPPRMEAALGSALNYGTFEWAPVADLNIPEAQTQPCDTCGAAGHFSKCPACRGTGGKTCGECGSWTQCHRCHGGCQVTDPNGAEACERCGGKGVRDVDVSVVVRPDIHLSAVYLRRVREHLPHATICLPKAKDCQAVRIQFDGGLAVLATRRHDSKENHE